MAVSDRIAHSTNEWHTSKISILHPLALDLEQVAVAKELPALSAPAQKLSTTSINTSHPILLRFHNAKVHLHQSTLCHQITVFYFKPTAISMIGQAMCRIWASLPIPYSKTLTTSTFQLRRTTTSANIPRSQTSAEDSSLTTIICSQDWACWRIKAMLRAHPERKIQTSILSSSRSRAPVFKKCSDLFALKDFLIFQILKFSFGKLHGCPVHCLRMI